jgi:dephospho-CoA kinase
MPIAIAVSGGIAAGKSAVCAVLAECGAAVIDADVVARQLVQPGQPALLEIGTQLGGQFITANGELDRAALRARVFANAEDKRRLEQILHPRIQAELFQQCQAASAAVLAVAIPLLSPQNRQTAYAWLQRVLIVEAPRATQIARISVRDGSTPALAEAMVNAQLSMAERLPMADDVLINDGSLQQLDAWARRLYGNYLAMPV